MSQLVQVELVKRSSTPASNPSADFVYLYAKSDNKLYTKNSAGDEIVVGEGGLESYANLAGFPVSGETNKLYLALDTSILYHWTGSIYAIVNQIDEASITEVENPSTTNANTFVSPRRAWTLWEKIKTLVSTIAEIWTFSKGIILGNNTSPSANGSLWFDGTDFKGRRLGTDISFLTGNLLDVNIPTPPTLIGTVGDKKHERTGDANYFYYAFKDYDGTQMYSKIPAITGEKIEISVATPATLTDAGKVGQQAWNSTSHTLFECVASNTWRMFQADSVEVAPSGVFTAVFGTTKKMIVVDNTPTLDASPLDGTVRTFLNTSAGTVTVGGNSRTIVGITTITANGRGTFIYLASTNAWYRVGG